MRNANKLLIFVLMAIMLSSLVFAMGVPTVNTPVASQVVFTTVNLTWDAVAPNSTHYVTTYNITLLNSSTHTFVLVQTIENVSNTTLFDFLTLTNNASGYYVFGVEAVTNNSAYSPTGYSGNFTLDHAEPNISSVAITSNFAGYYTTATLTCTGTYNDAPYNTAESGSTFRWFLDGAVVAGQTASTYSGAQTDTSTLICEYTPSDGYNIGTPSNSSSVTITTAEATGCASTQRIIYAAFALIAVGIIVLAGFMIIQLFKGDVSGSEVLIAVVIGSVAIGIVVLVGYVVVDKVGASVCTIG